jgi:hypothetical protein
LDAAMDRRWNTPSRSLQIGATNQAEATGGRTTAKRKASKSSSQAKQRTKPNAKRQTPNAKSVLSVQ